MYADDYGGILPPFSNDFKVISSFDPQFNISEPLESKQPSMLVDAVEPYLGNRSLWYCPSDNERRTKSGRFNSFHEHSSYIVASHNFLQLFAQYPPQVNIDLGENGFLPLLSDGYEFPFGSGPWSNHSDSSVFMIRCDLSAVKTSVPMMFGGPFHR